jgi:hypothetical protein
MTLKEERRNLRHYNKNYNLLIYSIVGIIIAYKERGVIDSVQKEGPFTANSFVSIDGRYSFSLPSGLYRLR